MCSFWQFYVEIRHIYFVRVVFVVIKLAKCLAAKT